MSSVFAPSALSLTALWPLSHIPSSSPSHLCFSTVAAPTHSLLSDQRRRPYPYTGSVKTIPFGGNSYSPPPPNPPCDEMNSAIGIRVAVTAGIHARKLQRPRLPFIFRSSSSASAASSTLQPPDVVRLAETARITLSPREVEEFAPKIRQVVDWFGQLQAVDLESFEPALRADTENANPREDLPENFDSWEAMLAAVPSFEEPYIKVPKVLNVE